MHEFTLIQNICKAVDKTAAENNLRIVTHIHLQVGKMRQVIPEFMQFAFATIAKGTIYENAELIIEVIPIKILCHNCGREFEVEENIYLCPFCSDSNKDISASSIEILSGKEFILVSVEGEQSG